MRALQGRRETVKVPRIGLNHGYQLRGYEGADWAAFDRYLLYSLSERIDLIGEESNEEAIDLGPALRGPIFEPLRDPAVFRRFSIHPEFHTLIWPNGADFAPEFLHDNVRVTA